MKTNLYPRIGVENHHQSNQEYENQNIAHDHPSVICDEDAQESRIYGEEEAKEAIPIFFGVKL